MVSLTTGFFLAQDGPLGADYVQQSAPPVCLQLRLVLHVLHTFCLLNRSLIYYSAFSERIGMSLSFIPNPCSESVAQDFR